jgi:hypothetical protein
MTEDELNQYPLSGSIFAIKVDAQGIKANSFKRDILSFTDSVS